MKRNHFIIIIFIALFTFASCQLNPEAENRKMIIGEWYPLDESNMNGYEFKEDNLCENKWGYFTYPNKLLFIQKVEADLFQSDIDKLAEEVNRNWWEKNKTRFLKDS